MQFIDNYGNEVELPTLTVAINDALNKASKGQNDTAGFNARYEFLKSILSADYLKEVLGGSNINEIDLMALSTLFSQVQLTYTEPMIEQSLKPALKMLEEVAPMLEKMNVIQSNTNNSRQVFNRVK